MDRIRAVKEQARSRLLAIPGVHAVAIGAKRVGGAKTAEPAIVLFVVKKKAASELRPEEMIPSEIDGIPTDVVEEEMPRLFSGGLPDEEPYDVMEGGIQIQAGTKVTGFGTLGCIARTDDPEPKIVALTCQHVVALWSASELALKVWVSPDKHKVILYGANVAGWNVQCAVSLVPTGAGATQQFGPFNTVATNADTPVSLMSKLATAINTPANPNFSVTAGTQDTISGMGGTLQITAVGAFDAQLDCQIQPLWSTSTGVRVTTFAGVPLAGHLVVTHILLLPPPPGASQSLDVFYPVVSGDTLHSVAVNVASRINGLSNPGVTATGPALPNGSEVTIAAGGVMTAILSGTSVYPPMGGDPDTKLHAAVAGSVVTLSGSVAGDDYGIYTNVNLGGTTQSIGLFHQPGKNTALSAVAGAIAGNLTAKNIPGVTITASGAQITVTGAEEVECFVTSDIRVGQSTKDFGSSCCHCCNKRFGRILDARLDLDVAMIQLDAGKKYKAEIEGIGVVSGTHQITAAEVIVPGVYKVKKRGRTTGLKDNGTVDYLDRDGDIAGDVFHRYYTGAMLVTGNSFSAPGDSGSAVLNSANEVVGILFGGGTATTLATPIQTIANALGVIVETATVANDVRTVPATAHAMTMLPQGAMAAQAVAPEFDWTRLHEAELEIAATPGGGEIMGTLRKHIPETQALVLENKRFAATWRRYGGPLIVQGVLRMAQTRSQPMPATIKGRPLKDCLNKIQEVLVQCASPELCRDVAQYQEKLEMWLTLTYAELVRTLQVSGQE